MSMMTQTTPLHFVVPILLAKGEEKPEDKGNLITCKIKSDPNDKNSTVTHDMKIKMFKSGTTEEWLLAWQAFKLVLKGQGLDSGSAQFRFARVFLKGDALFKFNLIVKELKIDEKSETPDKLEECFKKLTEKILPHKAIRNQKCYLSRIAKKPADMKFRDYVTRMIEINDHLSSFPPDFHEDQKYSKFQLMEFIEFGMPKGWQIKMMENNIDLGKDETSFDKLVDFGERMELLEAQSRTQKMGTMSDMIPKKFKTAHKAHGSSLIKQSYKTHFQKKWCPYHKTDSHDANTCVVISKVAADLAQKKAEKDKKFPAAGNGKFDKKKFEQFQAFVHFQKMQEEQAKNEEAEGSAMYFDLVEEGEVKETEMESQEISEDGYEDLDMADMALLDLDE